MKIGIIGGVSPYAYASFYMKLCDEYRNKYQKYPRILSYSVEVSESQEIEFFTNDLSSETLEHLYDELDKACLIFKQNNISVVTICCNTLSNLFQKVASKYKFDKILTPINAVDEHLKQNNIIAPLLLATSFSVENDLYKGVTKLNDDDQVLVDKFITDKVNNIKSKVDIDNIIKKYSNPNVVLGCTDIVLSDIKCSVNSIDSVECLLDNCLNNMRE